MRRNYAIGKPGLAAAVLISAALIAVAYSLMPEKPLPGQPGICLPPPSEWTMDPLWSCLINGFILAVIAAGTFVLNRAFNFIRSTQPVLPAVFMVTVASNPWITEQLSTSMLLCLANVLIMAVLFNAYAKPNATQDLFLIATFLSVGSMFQYAFIPMIAAAIAGAVAMKVLRFKEVLAFLMGLIAPYWVTVGLGIIPLSNFRLSEISPLFSDYERAADLFLLLLSVATACFIGLSLGIVNAIRLYAGNSKVNAMNTVIFMTGIVCILCIIFDFNNMLAYLATLYFTVAAQIANACALWRMRHEWIVPSLMVLIFISFFILMVIF